MKFLHAIYQCSVELSLFTIEIEIPKRLKLKFKTFFKLFHSSKLQIAIANAKYGNF